ncbi:sensor histidine kinase [Coralloluteibacterium stylophorae]|uniref:histidine kinase n=2 Tax=Coralloluteibacterium stylophorae TaxID=1776034 RepID=A0AAP2G1R9_9GAMM|nr:PAS domain-containing sensor histidine kinase [Coralloluteibacterium stylophorae]MBS7457983.1 PAS domain-containing sensor histidine kinase [Coralloluteibacterium stylophorae]
MPRRRLVPRLSLVARHSVGGCLLVAAGAGAALALRPWLASPWAAWGMAILLLAPLCAWVAQRTLAPALSLFRALAGTVNSYRDGDFSFGLHWARDDELADLVAAHNALGATLREQRLGLAQRELLLDTMVQNTPVAMLLCDPSRRVVYANLAARKLLNDGRRLEGMPLDAVFAAGPEALREAVARGGDGLFAIGRDEDEEDTFHLARRGFRLNGRVHELILLRHLTAELRRQEVRTWKKVIRVISHELNNSLAPIASLAHSGGALLERGRTEKLAEVFATIEDRARHLEGFIRGYARFAKLPAPRLEPTPWPGFVERLRSQIEFRIDGTLPGRPGRFDPAQMEQALINLLRNAHESGSPADAVSLGVRRLGEMVAIEVRDRGGGMSEAVLANALLPFYSTKRGGTGLGLALVREIAEAHGGRLSLSNRDGGGLAIAVLVPE